MGPRSDARRSFIIWIYTVRHRGFKNISVDSVSRRVVIGALRVNECEFSVYNVQP